MSTSTPHPSAPQLGPGATTSVDDIERWLVQHIADVLRLDPAAIDPRAPFSHCGVDSAAAIALTGDLGAWLGRDLDPTLPYDYPTIERLARHLGSQR